MSCKKVRIPRLTAEEVFPDLDVMSLTPAERLVLVGVLTKRAYESVGAPYPERVRRDIVRVWRNGRRVR